MTADVAAFMAARLDEEETEAKGPPGWKLEHWTAVKYADKPSGRNWRIDAEPRCVVDAVAEEDALFIVRRDPASVLRSIAADRRLLAELDRCQGDPGWDSAIMLAVRCRAMAWNTHEDYRPEWKP